MLNNVSLWRPGCFRVWTGSSGAGTGVSRNPCWLRPADPARTDSGLPMVLQALASDALTSLTRVFFVPNHRIVCGKSSPWLRFSREGKPIASWCFEDVGLPVYCSS